MDELLETSNYILSELRIFNGGETDSAVRFLRYSVKWGHFKVSGERGDCAAVFPRDPLG